MADLETQDIPTSESSAATIRDRIAAFQMLDGMKDATQAQKSLRLALIGFSNKDIAAMLQTTTATVSQNLYLERNKAKKAAKKPAKKASSTG